MSLSISSYARSTEVVNPIRVRLKEELFVRAAENANEPGMYSSPITELRKLAKESERFITYGFYRPGVLAKTYVHKQLGRLVRSYRFKLKILQRIQAEKYIEERKDVAATKIQALVRGKTAQEKFQKAKKVVPNIQASNRDDQLRNQQLRDAVRNGDIDRIQKLITNGVNVDALNILDGSTSLYLAVESGDKAIVKLLIENGADVNAKHSIGWTPLHFAVQKGDKEIVELLLASRTYKTDENAINARNCIGETVLHVAARLGREEIGDEIVNLLLAKGADVNAKDSRDYTAVQLAAKNGHDAILWETNFRYKNPYFTGHVAIAKSLVIAGADLEYQQYATDVNEAIEDGKRKLISLYNSQRNHLSKLQIIKAEKYLKEKNVPVAIKLTSVEATSLPIYVNSDGDLMQSRWDQNMFDQIPEARVEEVQTAVRS